jgi:hypothetical protein
MQLEVGVPEVALGVGGTHDDAVPLGAAGSSSTTPCWRSSARIMVSKPDN